MSDLLVADFSNARVGDSVKNLYGFEGKIICIEDGIIFIERIDDIIRCSIDEQGYCLERGNGVFVEYPLFPLWFYYFEGQFPTKEACKRPLQKIEVDTKILVRPIRTKQWIKYYATGKICELGYIQVFSFGRTEWSNNGLMGGTDSFKYWKLADDPTINSGNLEGIEG